MERLTSVIVPVRNAGRDLSELVQALAAQTLPRERFEVLIGDDGSADGAADGLEAEDGWLRVVRGPPLNSYAARNRAARLARGSALVFCDADSRPESTWLEAGVAALEDADIAAGFIRFRQPARKTIWTILDVDMFLDQERSVRTGKAVTANLFVRRECFDRVGGFDDSLPNTGDYDFVSRCVAAGARLVFAREAVVSHPTRDSARSLLRKIWAVNRRYAEREARHRRKPHGLELRSWVPLVQPFRGRRRSGRSVLPDRKRLAESGIAPRPWDDLRALPLMYLAIPYYAGAAQLVGWWRGRQTRDSSS